MRYTRQLATAALIVAAGLGMGACSAHPGAAVVSSSGSYSNEEVAQAAQQMSVLLGGQKVADAQIRSQLVNLPLLEAAGASVGTVVSDEQIDQVGERAAEQSGDGTFTLGPATRATVKSIMLTQALNHVAQTDPSAVQKLNQVIAEAREKSDARVNPRFVQPSLGGAQGATTPMFGDAISGGQHDPLAAPTGGGKAN